jgi:hypothetical protein
VYLRVNLKLKTPKFVRAYRTSYRGLRARSAWPCTSFLPMYVLTYSRFNDDDKAKTKTKKHNAVADTAIVSTNGLTFFVQGRRQSQNQNEETQRSCKHCNCLDERSSFTSEFFSLYCYFKVNILKCNTRIIFRLRW